MSIWTRLMQGWDAPDVEKRVFLFGAPLVGRSEVISRLAEELGIPPETTGPFTIRSVRGSGFAVAAVTGAAHYRVAWQDLIEWSNRLLILLDPQRPLQETTNWWLKEFKDYLPKPPMRAVQVTKVDLAEQRSSNCFVPAEVPGIYGLGSLPVFYSTIRRPATLTAGVRYLLSAA